MGKLLVSVKSGDSALLPFSEPNLWFYNVGNRQEKSHEVRYFLNAF